VHTFWVAYAGPKTFGWIAKPAVKPPPVAFQQDLQFSAAFEKKASPPAKNAPPPLPKVVPLCEGTPGAVQQWRTGLGV